MIVILAIYFIFISDKFHRLEFKLQQLEKKLNQATQPAVQAQLKNSEASQPAVRAAAVTPAAAPDTAHADVIGEIFTPRTNPEPDALLEVFTPPADTPRPAQKPFINWQQFTAVKLFSWIGGFTLFLGVVFWIKYSIENNLISPAMRVMLSAGLGILLVSAGLFLKRKELKTTSDTLCGSGIAVLYACIYAAYAFYGLIGQHISFALMVLVSLSAFVLALYKNAKYIGFLGTIIAFLTPLLLSSQNPNYFFFFSYILLINAATIATAWRKSWNSLIVCSFIFTWLCQAYWAITPTASQSLIFVTLFILYTAGAAWVALKSGNKTTNLVKVTAGLFIAAQLLLCIPLLNSLGQQPIVFIPVLGFALCVNLLLAYLTVKEPQTHKAVFQVAKALAFALLLWWTLQHFTAALLMLTFCFYLAFAAVQAVADFRLHKAQQLTPAEETFASFYPVLFMLPLLLKFTVLGFSGLVVFAFLMLILLAGTIVLAVQSGKSAPVLAGCGLITLLLVLFACHVNLATFSPLRLAELFAISLLPVLLLTIVLAILKKYTDLNHPSARLSLLTCSSALMPYLLIMSVVAAAHKTSLSVHIVFGFALAVAAVTGIFAWLHRIATPLLVALAGITLVQLFYGQLFVFDVDNPQLTTAYHLWLLLPFVLFTAFTFTFRKRFLEVSSAWAASALSGVSACLLLYVSLKTQYLVAHPGLLPLAFALVYAAALNVMWSWQPPAEKAQRQRLAIYGSCMLFFITLIFPLEYSGIWLTLAWGLEGAACLALGLYKRYKPLGLFGIILIGLVTIKMLLLDIWGLGSLHRILGLFGIAAILLLVSLFYQKFKERF